MNRTICTKYLFRKRLNASQQQEEPLACTPAIVA